METLAFWQAGEAIITLTEVKPRLACWDAKTAPSQIRMQAYLDDIQQRVGVLDQDGLFLHLDVDVEQQKRLEKHHDLENYLTPLVDRLGRHRFVLATATKFVGGGSRLTIGKAVAGARPAFAALEFSCACSSDEVKKQVRQRLVGQPGLAPGPVEVWHAWRCPPAQNWVSLWKPTGDGMGPVLGEPYPDRPYYPNDDRIVSIAMHLTVDPQMARIEKVVGVYWRHMDLALVQPAAESERKVGRMLDYIVLAARVAGAEGQPVRLADLFRVYREQFPDLPKGRSEASYSATVGFHTINMRSRFNLQLSEESQAWLREPVFKRVGRGSYMLLSPEEIAAFRRAWAAGNSLVRADEYDVDELRLSTAANSAPIERHFFQGATMNTLPFKDDEKGYLTWIGQNPEGYVLNIQRGLNPSDARLHRASCVTISRPNGGPWTKDYVKICSGMLGALEDWARKEAGVDIEGCGTCHPHDD